MSKWIREIVDSMRGPTPEQIEAVQHFFNPPAPEPEVEETPEDTFTDHIKVHGLPRFLSYRDERVDN